MGGCNVSDGICSTILFGTETEVNLELPQYLRDNKCKKRSQ